MHKSSHASIYPSSHSFQNCSQYRERIPPWAGCHSYGPGLAPTRLPRPVPWGGSGGSDKPSRSPGRSILIFGIGLVDARGVNKLLNVRMKMRCGYYGSGEGSGVVFGQRDRETTSKK